MAGFSVQGNHAEIKKCGKDMQNLATELSTLLKSTDTSVENMEKSGFAGGPAEQLTSIYTELSADLKKYLKRFTVLGENLEKSGMNLEQVELNAKSTLVRK